MVIQQGDVFWLDTGAPSGSSPGYRHPYVVVQNNLFNQSKISTVVLCALTSNLARSAEPGNVRLSKGEANLKKPSVVNVTQIVTVVKQDLTKKIGVISQTQVQKIIEGLKLVLEPRNV